MTTTPNWRAIEGHVEPGTHLGMTTGHGRVTVVEDDPWLHRETDPITFTWVCACGVGGRAIWVSPQ